MLSVRNYQYQTAQFNYCQFFTTELKEKVSLLFTHLLQIQLDTPHCEKMVHCFDVPYSVLSIFSLIPFSNDKTEFTAILKCFNFLKNLMCMGKCLYICVPCVCNPQGSQKRVWDPLELEWQKVLQEPCECWELTPGPLPERHTLISTLQSLRAF